MFDQKSRYYQIDDNSYTNEDGSEIYYKKRRFIPPASKIASLVNVKVEKGQRLDQISAAALGESQFYWKIGDANPSFSLSSLENSCEQLRIPVQGADHG